MFEKAGCAKANVEVQSVPDQSLPNVVCTLPGTEFGTILIAARLDYDGRGEEGAVGWGGVVMLPLLAESLTSASHRHTLVFAAFSGSNMAGAAWYWKSLSEAQRREFRGMVDLDHLGRTAAGFSAANQWRCNGAPASGRGVARCESVLNRSRSLTSPRATLCSFSAPTFRRSRFTLTDTCRRILKLPAIGGQPAVAGRCTKSRGKHVARVCAEDRPRSGRLQPDLQPALRLRAVPRSRTGRKQTSGYRGVARAVDATSATQVSGSAQRRCDRRVVQNQQPIASHDGVRGSAPAVTTAPSEIAAPTSPVPSPVSAAAPNNSSAATFRVNTRLVQFDVVVTDNQGRPVKDLTAADFTVLQDGQVQTVRAFEVHAPAAVRPRLDPALT